MSDLGAIFLVLIILGFIIYIIGTCWLFANSIEAQEKAKDTKYGGLVNKLWLSYLVFLGLTALIKLKMETHWLLDILDDFLFIFVLLLPILILRKAKKNNTN